MVGNKFDEKIVFKGQYLNTKLKSYNSKIKTKNSYCFCLTAIVHDSVCKKKKWKWWIWPSDLLGRVSILRKESKEKTDELILIISKKLVIEYFYCTKHKRDVQYYVLVCLIT